MFYCYGTDYDIVLFWNFIMKYVFAAADGMLTKKYSSTSLCYANVNYLSFNVLARKLELSPNSRHHFD